MIEDLSTGEFIDIFLVPPPPETKTGTLSPGAFTGTPRLAAVTFEVPFDDATYVVSLTGEDARLFTYQSKLATGFVINANSDDALSGEVSWIATVAGESP